MPVHNVQEYNEKLLMNEFEQIKWRMDTNSLLLKALLNTTHQKKDCLSANIGLGEYVFVPEIVWDLFVNALFVWLFVQISALMHSSFQIPLF